MFPWSKTKHLQYSASVAVVRPVMGHVSAVYGTVSEMKLFYYERKPQNLLEKYIIRYTNTSATAQTNKNTMYLTFQINQIGISY